jgi:hypothetical protein
MVGLASDLKMQTTAEGVETQEELQLGPQPRLLARPGLYLRQADAGRGGARARQEGRGDLPDATCRRASRASASSAPRCSTIDGQVKGARLRNISSGGALVECREEVRSGRADPARLRRRRPDRRRGPLDQGHAVRLPLQQLHPLDGVADHFGIADDAEIDDRDQRSVDVVLDAFLERAAQLAAADERRGETLFEQRDLSSACLRAARRRRAAPRRRIRAGRRSPSRSRRRSASCPSAAPPRSTCRRRRSARAVLLGIGESGLTMKSRALSYSGPR